MSVYSIDSEGAIASVLSGTEFDAFDAGGTARVKKVTAAQLATFVLASPVTTGLVTFSSASALTAGTTRTQTGALALTKEVNRVDTSTAPSAGTLLGDGVALPTAAAGLDIVIINNTANPIQVYGILGGSDTINGVAGATGIAQAPNSIVYYIAASTVCWETEGVATGYANGLQTQLSQDAMTAHAGGGQGSAQAIKSMIARFTTVANGTPGTNDSAVLPASAVGLEITVINAAAANTMDVFPVSGDAINSLAANKAYSLPAGTVATFYCTVAGTWHTITSATGTSVSARLSHTGGRPPASNADFTSATPSSTETYVCEVFVPATCSVTGIGIVNGSAVSGNVTVYLADSTGQQLAHSASTAQSGTSAYQRVPFTAPLNVVGPGTYFVVLQVDNNTARYGAHVFGDFGASKVTATTYGTFPTITPPTTFTTNLGPVAHLY
jgi:hypothetical protein